MPQGTVTKWIDHRGFGFIEPDGEGGSIFSHISRWPAGSTPLAGDRVSFDVHTGVDGRPAAINVRPISAALEEAERVFGGN